MKYHILATLWVAERRPGDAVKRAPTGSESRQSR